MALNSLQADILQSHNMMLNRQIEEEPYKNVYLIQMYTGLRVGEDKKIKSGDIDLRKNLIRIK